MYTSKQARKFKVVRLKIQNFVSKLNIFIYVSDAAKTDWRSNYRCVVDSGRERTL